MDKLGSGVFEFFNEPRKGMLRGPKEFVGGMGKGVQSLVAGVVGGSFDAVSKGVIDLRDLLYFVSLIVAWLAATAVAVDLKKAE